MQPVQLPEAEAHAPRGHHEGEQQERECSATHECAERRVWVTLESYARDAAAPIETRTASGTLAEVLPD